jgi:hypothetical protein
MRDLNTRLVPKDVVVSDESLAVTRGSKEIPAAGKARCDQVQFGPELLRQDSLRRLEVTDRADWLSRQSASPDAAFAASGSKQRHRSAAQLSKPLAKIGSAALAE